MPAHDVVEDLADGVAGGQAEAAEALESQQRVINRAASEGRMVRLYAPSVLLRAARALSALQDALTQHGLDDTPQFPTYSTRFAGQVLAACAHDCRIDCIDDYIEGDVDPVALVTAAVHAASQHLGRPLEPSEGPALSPHGRAVFGYAVLPRQAETPEWGESGTEPLVLSLGREDQHALDVACSSGGGWPGPYDPGPWSWYLGHRVPHDTCIRETHLVTRAPSREVAAEVGVIAAEVLAGSLPLPR